MPVPDTSGVPPFADFEMLKNKLNEIVQKYNNLLVNMDSLNVVSLTADHIDSGTINAGVVTIRADLQGGAYIQLDSAGGLIINDGTKNTFVANIQGKVTATGATIQSATGYPMIVLDPDNNIIGVYTSTTNYISFNPIAGGFTAPQIKFHNGGADANLYLTTALLSILSTKDISISSGGGTVQIQGNAVTVPSWTAFSRSDTGQTLQAALNAKANSFSGFTGTVYVATTPGGSPTTAKTFSNGICTS